MRVIYNHLHMYSSLILILYLICIPACFGENSVLTYDTKIITPEFEGFRFVNDKNSKYFKMFEENVPKGGELLAVYLSEDEIASNSGFNKLIMLINLKGVSYEFSNPVEWDKSKEGIIKGFKESLSKESIANNIRDINEKNSRSIQIENMERNLLSVKEDKKESLSMFEVISYKISNQENKIILNNVAGTSIVNLNGVAISLFVKNKYNSDQDIEWVKYVSEATISKLLELNPKLKKDNEPASIAQDLKYAFDKSWYHFSAESYGGFLGSFSVYLLLSFVIFAIASPFVGKKKVYNKVDINKPEIKKSILNKMFFPHGKLNQIDFGMCFLLLLFGFSILVTLCMSLMEYSPFFSKSLILILGICAFYILFCMGIKRLRDMKISIWCIILLLIPYVQMIFLAVLMFFPGRHSD